MSDRLSVLRGMLCEIYCRGVSVTGLQGLAVRYARCGQGLCKMAASCWFAK